jgi:hypothetical protein
MEHKITDTIFTARPEHLEHLAPAEAVEVFADLLWAEARRIGLPTTSVNTSTRVTVAGGGIDASIDLLALPAASDSFIPGPSPRISDKDWVLLQTLAEITPPRGAVRVRGGGMACIAGDPSPSCGKPAVVAGASGATRCVLALLFGGLLGLDVGAEAISRKEAVGGGRPERTEWLASSSVRDSRSGAARKLAGRPSEGS